VMIAAASLIRATLLRNHPTHREMRLLPTLEMKLINLLIFLIIVLETESPDISGSRIVSNLLIIIYDGLVLLNISSCDFWSKDT
jgi:hypothetical protein